MKHRGASAIIWAMLFLGSCASERQRDWNAPMPPEAAQPRLKEVLAYLAEHGFAPAGHASIFEFTAWPMYRDPSWEDEPRKPRFEAASFVHDGKRIEVTVSPVKPYHSDGKTTEKVIQTFPKDSREPDGASIVLEGRTWTVAYKLEAPDAKLERQLTELLREFVRDYLRRLAQEGQSLARPSTAPSS